MSNSAGVASWPVRSGFPAAPNSAILSWREGRPVMPGVLIIEAMAQTAAVLVVHTLGREAEGKLVYFMSVDNARFRRPVFPGDCLHVHVTKQRNRGNVWKFEGRAEVGGQLMAEAIFAAMILDD